MSAREGRAGQPRAAGPRGSRGRRVSEGRAPGRAEGGPGPPGFPRRARSSNPVPGPAGAASPQALPDLEAAGSPCAPTPGAGSAFPCRPLGRTSPPPAPWDLGGTGPAPGSFGAARPPLTLRNVGPREPDADPREGDGVSRRLSSAAASSGHGDLPGRGVAAPP